MADTYNGWTNYATYCVNVLVFERNSLDDLDLKQCGLNELSEALRDYANEIIAMTGKGLALEFARAFLADVCWSEIAAHYIVDPKYRWGGTKAEVK